MNSSETYDLKIIIEHDNRRIEFKGKYTDVWLSTNRYLSEFYPALPVAKKLTSAVDVVELAESIAGKVQISEGGVVVVEPGDAKTKILLALAGLYVGKTLERVKDDSVTPRELATATGLGQRVVRARVSEMRRAGLVIRVEEGKYRFSPASAALLTSS